MQARDVRRLAALLVGLLLLVTAGRARALVYCTITSVDAQAMSNGVRITVKSDGILELSYGGGYYGGESGSRANSISLTFTNAKNGTGRNFIDVSEFPVSHIQLAVPQGATEGVGVVMTVGMLEPSGYDLNFSSDRQSLIINVRSERNIERRAKGRAAEKKAGEKEVSVEVADGRVSVTAVKADLQELLGEIAKKTSTNIAVDDAVKAEVNLHLSGLTIGELLPAMASAYGLALSQRHGVYMFSSGVAQDLSAYRLSGTASFPMRYTRAQTASGLLPTFLYSYLHVNEEQNAVVVTAPEQMLDKIRRDLQAVDIAPPQIMIEATAVEFTDTRDLDKVLRTARGDVTGTTTETGEQDLWLRTDSREGELSYANIGRLPYDFEARLRALEAEQRASVRAAPRMAVMNGHEADIFIGTRRFIKVEYIVFNQTTEKIQGVDVGVKLQVRPLTGGAGEITLTIDPGGAVVSNVSEVDPQTGLPVLSTRQAGTSVRVKDGETVMIGGLSQHQTEDRVTKTPLLGDLPLVGGLFRSRSRSEVSSELVVFITPHILTPEGRLADDDQERVIRDRFLTPVPADATSPEPATPVPPK
jgi:type IV pilus assembly protein PilQ